MIIGVTSCETFYSPLQFGFSRITVTEFHKHPLCSEYGSTYSQGIVNMLSKNTLAFCRLWFCFEISVIKTFSFQALGITEFKETKMYFIFFFFSLQMIHQFHSSRLQTSKFQFSEKLQSVKWHLRIESEDTEC